MPDLRDMFEKARESARSREQAKPAGRPEGVSAKDDMATRARSVDERSAALKAQRLERDRTQVGTPVVRTQVARAQAAVESSTQFKKQPKRASSKGKSVAVSDEARQAYEEQIRQRDERERTYLRHLPHADNKPNR